MKSLRARSTLLISLDSMDFQSAFRRACVMRSCLAAFFVGGYSSAMRLAMTEAELGSASGDEQRRTRGWKLFLLLPPNHHEGSYCPSRRCWIGSASSTRARGIDLLLASQECSERVLQLQRRRNRTQQDSVERRAKRAEALVYVGELSAGRQALEGGPLTQWNELSLRELQNPARRPPVPRAPIPDDLLTVEPETPFVLELDLFLKNLKCARRGVAGGGLQG